MDTNLPDIDELVRRARAWWSFFGRSPWHATAGIVLLLLLIGAGLWLWRQNGSLKKEVDKYKQLVMPVLARADEMYPNAPKDERVDRLIQDANDAQKQRAELMSELKESKGREGQLQEQLQAARGGLAKVMVELQDAKKRGEQLQQELENVRSELKEIKDKGVPVKSAWPTLTDGDVNMLASHFSKVKEPPKVIIEPQSAGGAELYGVAEKIQAAFLKAGWKVDLQPAMTFLAGKPPNGIRILSGETPSAELYNALSPLSQVFGSIDWFARSAVEPNTVKIEIWPRSN